jgi:hypothetical protein
MVTIKTGPAIAAEAPWKGPLKLRRVYRNQEADHSCCRTVRLGVIWQQRQDQAEAKQVNEDDQEDIGETTLVHDDLYLRMESRHCR